MNRSAAGVVALTVLAAVSGCTGNFDRNYRNEYAKGFRATCIADFAYEHEPKVPALCTCAGEKMAAGLNSAELMETELGVAPPSVQRKRSAAIHVCVVKIMGEPRTHRAFRRYVPPDRCMHEAVVTDAVQPNFPDSARNITRSLQVEILVTIAPSGSLADASIYKSSGYPDVDAEAIRAARLSSYAPRVVRCHAVAGSYLFKADFEPD